MIREPTRKTRRTISIGLNVFFRCITCPPAIHYKPDILAYPEFLPIPIIIEQVKMPGNPGMEAGNLVLVKAACVKKHGVDSWVCGSLFKLSKGHIAGRDTHIGCIEQ